MTGVAKPHGRTRFFLAVVVPVAVATLLAVATAFFVVAWTTGRNDAEALSRQTTLVSHILSDERNLIVAEQEEVAVWNHAHRAVQGPDMRFINENLGVGLYEFFGHDRAYLLNPRLKPIYAMRSGGATRPDTYSSVKSVVEPLAERLKEISWQGALAAYINGSSDIVPNVSDVVLLDGQPAIVSLMPIIAEDENIPQIPGNEFIHVTAEFLDGELAEELTDLLLLEGARFSIEPSTDAAEHSLAIRNSNGQPVVYFSWQPDRPGARLMREVAPGVGAAALMAGLIIAMLVVRLRRRTSQLESQRAEAQHMAFNDRLTGLGNRALYEKAMGEFYDRAKAEDSSALLLLDLDRFKQVNDTLGHEAGDELIQQVAQRVLPLVRSHDTVTRLGGDEFAILAHEIDSDKSIAALCDRIVAAIRKPFDLKAGQAFVGVSIGVAFANQKAIELRDLTRKADIALYEAKAAGRNQFKIFEDTMADSLLRRQNLESDLRQALEAGDQLEVVFDPLVHVNGSEIVCMEAQVRWKHPELGELTAPDFLPLAESTGLIDTIGDIVLHEVCDMGAKHPERRISMRLYPAQLRHPYFFDKVFSCASKSGINPGNVELEIDEIMFSDGEEVATANLRKFRQAGFRIALNDFGKGFTSLGLLQRFNVDRVKIDRSFIAQLADSPDPEAITHAVVWLARAIDVEVSADGVDTLEQKEFLARMGCMSFQGALFDPEGQAAWLRHAANIEKNTAEQNTPAPSDVELWDETG